MNKRTLWNMTIVVATIVIFIFYPAVLGIALIPSIGLPLGGLITAIGIICWAGIFRRSGSWIHGEKTIISLLFKNLARLYTLMAWSWFPISWWASGNLGFNFENEPYVSEMWWQYTYACLWLPLVLGLIDRIVLLIRRIRA